MVLALTEACTVCTAYSELEWGSGAQHCELAMPGVLPPVPCMDRVPTTRHGLGSFQDAVAGCFQFSIVTVCVAMLSMSLPG